MADTDTETESGPSEEEIEQRMDLALSTTQDILKHVLDDAECKTSLEDGNIYVTVDTSEPGLLIGRKGSTLDALQFLVRRIVDRTIRGPRIILESGGYREQQEEAIVELAKEAAEAAKSQGRPQAIENLTGGQRRIVHTTLQDDPDVKTESRGEGEDRILIVTPV
jgi:spoIIIJ-associated protein